MNNMTEREREEADAKRVNEAMALIQRNNYAEASQILLSVVRNAPKVYLHTTEVNDVLYMRFWDQSEFVNFAQKAPPSRQTYWVISAYPRAVTGSHAAFWFSTGSCADRSASDYRRTGSSSAAA